MADSIFEYKTVGQPDTTDERAGQRDILPRSVKNRLVEDFTFDKASGGTLTLGGNNNQNGLLQIKDERQNVIVQGDTQGIHFYNTTGTELIRMGASGFVVYGTPTSFVFQKANGTEVGNLHYTGSGVILTTADNGNLFLDADNNVFISADAGISGTTDVGGVTFTATSGNVTLTSLDSEVKLRGTTNRFQLWETGTTYRDITINDNAGATRIQRSGSTAKTAIVNTSKGYKALYCIESPEVLFMDTAQVKSKPWWKFWKGPEYIIDPLFLETIEAVIHITPTMNKNTVLVWGHRKGFKDIRFEDKTEGQYVKNDAFWNQAK